MIGDIIHDKPEYLATAQAVVKMAGLLTAKYKKVVLIAGESGSGKSVTAIGIQKVLFDAGVEALILHQDDYFLLPPAQNHQQRMADVSKVGPSEVNLSLLAEHVEAFRGGVRHLTKPLVYYKQDQILHETINIEPYQVLIVEGTYAFWLPEADLRVFMDRNYLETRNNRTERGRELQTDFIEEVLRIEHRIIRPSRQQAHLIVQKNYEVIAHENAD